MTDDLVLSTFSGVGMLDAAFRSEGYCVVSAGDVCWGSLYDITDFHPPAGVFSGVIGGPPCQSFSSLAHLVRANGYEPRFGNLIPEFERVVAEAQPDWFLMENVPAAPAPYVGGYQVHELMLNNRWLGYEQNRLRRFCFGTRDGRPLVVDVALFEAPVTYAVVQSNVGGYSAEQAKLHHSGNGFDGGGAYYRRQSTAVVGDLRETPVKMNGGGKMKRSVRGAAVTATHNNGAVTSSDGGGSVKMVRYSLADACELQGLPRDFLEDAPFTAAGKLKLVANGVPLMMGRAVAAAVRRAMT